MPEWLLSAMQAEVPLFFLVTIRLVVGGEFLHQGYEKYRQGYPQAVFKKDEQLANPLMFQLETWSREEREVYSEADDGTLTKRTVRMFPWYQSFIDVAIKDNVEIFAFLVTAGEIAIGAFLILGLLVRVVAVLGFCMCLNYLFATWHLGFPFREFNILLMALMAVFLIAGAGRCLGVDAALHERFPEIPLF